MARLTFICDFDGSLQPIPRPPTPWRRSSCLVLQGLTPAVRPAPTASRQFQKSKTLSVVARRASPTWGPEAARSCAAQGTPLLPLRARRRRSVSRIPSAGVIGREVYYSILSVRTLSWTTCSSCVDGSSRR